MSTSNTLNYLFKCLQTIFRQWHINQMLPEPGMVVYINAVHLGERSQQCYISFSVGRWQKKKERRKFIAKLKILLFFPSPLLFIFFSNPSVNVSASSWYAPRWKVEAIPLKSSSSQNYHFISTPARKRRAGPLLTALGISLFIVCKLWRNIVAWENVLCGWWKWAVGATTKGEIRPIFSVGGTHKSENNAHYYRKTTSDFSAHNFLTAKKLTLKLNNQPVDPI